MLIRPTNSVSPTRSAHARLQRTLTPSAHTASACPSSGFCTWGRLSAFPWDRVAAIRARTDSDSRVALPFKRDGRRPPGATNSYPRPTAAALEVRTSSDLSENGRFSTAPKNVWVDDTVRLSDGASPGNNFRAKAPERPRRSRPRSMRCRCPPAYLDRADRTEALINDSSSEGPTACSEGGVDHLYFEAIQVTRRTRE